MPYGWVRVIRDALWDEPHSWKVFEETEAPRPFPEGLVEFHILIDALDCPAFGHPDGGGNGRADHRE